MDYRSNAISFTSIIFHAFFSPKTSLCVTCIDESLMMTL